MRSSSSSCVHLSRLFEDAPGLFALATASYLIHLCVQDQKAGACVFVAVILWFLEFCCFGLNLLTRWCLRETAQHHRKGVALQSGVTIIQTGMILVLLGSACIPMPVWFVFTWSKTFCILRLTLELVSSFLPFHPEN